MIMGRAPQPDLRAAFGTGADSAHQILSRVIAMALRYRGRFAVATVANLAASVFNLAVPWLLGIAVDRALALARGRTPEHGMRDIVLIAILVLLCSASRGGLQMAASYNGEWIGQSVARDLRLRYFDALQRLGFDFHDRFDSGDLITRGMLDLEGVRGFIEVGLQRTIQLVLLCAVGLVALLVTDPLIALVTLSFVPVVAWRAGHMGLRLRIAWTRLQAKMAVLTRVMEQSLQGARVVRSFAASVHELGRFDEAGDEALRLSNERIMIRAAGMASINAAYYTAMLLVLAVGGTRVSAGAITVGQLTSCLAYMTILQLPVRQTSMIMNSAARAVSSGARVFDVLDRSARIADAPDARPLGGSASELRFEHVSFRYAEDMPLVLKDVSFTVARGRTLGIVGASGSGKSTIAALIPRFYDVSAGRITIAGQDVRDLTLASLRSHVQLVQQDVFLFDDTGGSNIGYAHPDAEEDLLVDAADVAQIHDHLAGMPEGYATMLGERGIGLSGGQRQRMTIARGLVPEPSILILDDVTSALDASTERRFRQALRQRGSDHATIIISHRLTSLNHADEILVLDGGRIVERGTHAELLATNGAYAELHGFQSNQRDRRAA
jgi:ATP-binding cassette subfamily B protein